ncbi:MAG: bifunctional phosphoglucose/phosphomannose isomerase [Ignavibacteriales bacterium]|nr:bifunctional phosphoglucose/phosphomannose isomerase [Ignavibacteriales bacterium]
MPNLSSDLARLDPTGMYNWIKDFPRQIENAVAIGEKSGVKMNPRGIEHIVLTGLGGSAIGGDLLRSYLSNELAIPFLINRHYLLPKFVSKKTLVIVSSYSGNTEETISAYKDAVKRKARVLCITTGGTIGSTARKLKQPMISIPGGLSPRAALGYSFFPLLAVLAKNGFVKSKTREIREAIRVLDENNRTYSDPDSQENAPLNLARQWKGKLPVVYSPTDYLDAVNVRWRGQIAENAKQLCFGHVLPEMNHNELVGWNVLTELMKQMEVVFLRDRGTHPRVAVREELTKQITGKYAAHVTEVWSSGTSPLARMFSLIQFGDWVSYYLAILNDQDPTPVKVIDYLKGELAKV